MTRLIPRLQWRVLWQRLRRWWGESRIRLPLAGLRAEAVSPGDRLQIGSRLWRVVAASGSNPAATLELIGADGSPSRARLRVRGRRWTFTEPGSHSTIVEIDPAAVIHFSVGNPGSG